MLIRNARLVPLTEPAPQELDVLVEDGGVTRVKPGLVGEPRRGARRTTTWSTPPAAG